MAITYMQRRRSGIYEFRRMLPRSLAGKPAPAHVRTSLSELINPNTGCFKRELTVSLQTSDPREGKRKDMREGSRVADLFARAEELIAAGPSASTAPPTVPNLSELQSATVTRLLAKDEEEREGDDRRHFQSPEERAQWPHLMPLPASSAKFMMEDHWHAYGAQLEESERFYRVALSRRNPAVVEGELRALLRQHGYTGHPEAEWYHDAGLAVLRGHVEAFALMRKRQAGDDVPTPKPAASARGPTLSEAYRSWKTGSPARGTRKPSDRTLAEADRAVRLFTELYGDIRLGNISKERAREFRDALARLPTRLPEALRRLSLKDILKSRDIAKYPAPHGNTVNKSLNLLSAIVSNAEREGLTDNVTGFVNPFGKGLKLSVDEREGDSREPFTASDLTAIFSTPVYTHSKRPKGGCGEAAFWLPLIALLTGARQGELAQLRVADLQQEPETGLWFFDIGTDGGRTIKTASSRRKVPMHPELERIGLLRHRQRLLDQGTILQGALWPDLQSDKQGRRAGPWSKWFNRYLRDNAGVEDAAKVFHSFRHTFKRMARDAGVPEEVHDALTGHSGGGVGRSYGRGFGLRALAEAIGRVDVPEAVKALRSATD